MDSAVGVQTLGGIKRRRGRIAGAFQKDTRARWDLSVRELDGPRILRAVGSIGLLALGPRVERQEAAWRNPAARSRARQICPGSILREFCRDRYHPD